MHEQWKDEQTLSLLQNFEEIHKMQKIQQSKDFKIRWEEVAHWIKVNILMQVFVKI